MKKTNFILAVLGSAFGLAVLKKMNEKKIDKNSIKGKTKAVAGKVVGNDKLKAEGTLDQVLGASKEVVKDVKDSLSSFSDAVFGSGTTDKLKGETKKVAGDLTDNNKMKAEGFFDEVVGTSKEITSQVKDSIKDTIE